MTYEFELQADRTLTIKMPDDIPLGKHQVTLTIDEKPISHDKKEFKKLLEQTKGIWKQEDC